MPSLLTRFLLLKIRRLQFVNQKLRLEADRLRREAAALHEYKGPRELQDRDPDAIAA
jgi:hypothetical protein